MIAKDLKSLFTCIMIYDHVKRISIYVQTKIMRTKSTIPSVMQVVPFPLLDTLDRFFFDALVPARFSATCQVWSARCVKSSLLSKTSVEVSSNDFSSSRELAKWTALSLSRCDIYPLALFTVIECRDVHLQVAGTSQQTIPVIRSILLSMLYFKRQETRFISFSILSKPGMEVLLSIQDAFTKNPSWLNLGRLG
jgi:hypothetical protein